MITCKIIKKVWILDKTTHILLHTLFVFYVSNILISVICKQYLFLKIQL